MTSATIEAKNMRLLAQNALGGFGNGGEGLAIHVDKRGRRTLFIAHVSSPKDFTAVDVTDPRKPEVILQTDLPHEQVRSNSLSISGDLMAVARQVSKPGLTPAGIVLYDISEPDRPRLISFFDTSGPHSIGTHFVWFVDGEYAYLSTGMPDFKPRHPKDNQFVVIVDLRDPTKPTEVGRWWLPGTHEGDSEPPPKRPPQALAESLGLELPEGSSGQAVQVGDVLVWDFGLKPHNVNVYPRRPDRAYVGYLSGGAIILDISDKSHPKLAGRLEYSPPMPGFTHTVVPLFERQLLAISDESVVDRAADFPKLLWFADARYEPRPVIISTAPLPPLEKYRTAGRFGAHNLHENVPVETSWQSEEIIFGTFFNAGVRAYSVRNPFQPEEIGYLVPPAPDGAPDSTININDVYVDEHGIVYAIDRHKGGLYTIEFFP